MERQTDAQQAGGGGGGMAHHAKTRMEGRYINLSLHYLEQARGGGGG